MAPVYKASLRLWGTDVAWCDVIAAAPGREIGLLGRNALQTFRLLLSGRLAAYKCEPDS